jgi:hypothetical protein
MLHGYYYCYQKSKRENVLELLMYGWWWCIFLKNNQFVLVVVLPHIVCGHHSMPCGHYPTLFAATNHTILVGSRSKRSNFPPLSTLYNHVGHFQVMRSQNATLCTAYAHKLFMFLLIDSLQVYTSMQGWHLISRPIVISR